MIIQHSFLVSLWNYKQDSLHFVTYGYPFFRWNLICQTTDIWSKYSSEEELKNFTRTLLHIGGALEAYTKPSGLLNKAEEEIATNCTEEVIALSLKGITADLLANLEFYENEVGFWNK